MSIRKRLWLMKCNYGAELMSANEKLREALWMLPRLEMRVVLEIQGKNKSFDHTAMVLEISIEEVRRLFHKAMDRVRRHLRDDEGGTSDDPECAAEH